MTLSSERDVVVQSSQESVISQLRLFHSRKELPFPLSSREDCLFLPSIYINVSSLQDSNFLLNVRAKVQIFFSRYIAGILVYFYFVEYLA